MAHTSTSSLLQPEPSPPARRARPPRWLDLRLLFGLVLVVAAVVAGARIVSAADETVTVWAVTRDLAGGTTLTADDLRTVDVGLDEHAAAYIAATSDPTGKILSRDVGAGDLLPLSAVTPDTDLVALALSVPASNVPLTVARGDRVSIYATSLPAAGASSTPASTVLVVEASAVADVSDRSQGALSVGSGELQVVVKVPECAVAGILDLTVDKVLTVVEVGSAVREPAVC